MALIHDKSLRGTSKLGWLESYHTFSFGGFRDPARMGHGALRVLNEDFVIPGAGFASHGHEEMDILTYVISGALRHEDSIGNSSVIRAGEFQHMYAGTGVVHSEMNASKKEAVHFLQIWIIPEHRGDEPEYFQTPVDYQDAQNNFLQIAGPGQDDARVNLRSDTHVFLVRLDAGTTIRKDFAPGRIGFLQIVDGMVDIEGNRLSAGDGLQFEAMSKCSISAGSNAELLLFDMAPG